MASNPFSGYNNQYANRSWLDAIFNTGGFNPNGGYLPTTQQQNVTLTTLPNGTPQVKVGGTTLDKLLATLLSFTALQKGAGYVPTTQQPVDYNALAQQSAYQQQALYQQNLGNNNPNANFGAKLQAFIEQNTGVVAVVVIGGVLFMSGRKK